jgi:hypothetical protein
VGRGLYIGKYPPPPGGGEISAHLIWGKKYEKGKRKKGGNARQKERKETEKEKRRKNREIRSNKVK